MSGLNDNQTSKSDMDEGDILCADSTDSEVSESNSNEEL